MGWLFVLAASIAEITGVIGLRLFSNKKGWKNFILYIGGFGLSFILLYNSFQYLQLSVAYAVWVGVGTVGAVSVNILFFGESKDISRIVSMGAIIIGVIGLKAVS
ncbi:DMT family transporter [Domibacillus robiginosus]|uniref:DMT family transporter n=1 Tax=Domibacillus robiginosus TaxID=1071054 RepID=UPI00067B3DDF|nr:multidrug efflux SMR transporter [Domibacillus robiginosus]